MPLHQSWIFWFQAGTIAIVATVWYSSDFMTDAVLKLTSVSHWFSNKPGDNEIIWNNWHTWRWYHLPIFTSPLRVGRKWRQEGRRRGRGRKSRERQQMLPCQKSALHRSQHRSLFIQIRLGTFPAIIAGQHAEESDISHSTKLAALEAGGESVNVKRPTGYWTCCGPYSARGVGFVSSTSWCFFFTG